MDSFFLFRLREGIFRLNLISYIAKVNKTYKQIGSVLVVDKMMVDFC